LIVVVGAELLATAEGYVRLNIGRVSTNIIASASFSCVWKRTERLGKKRQLETDLLMITSSPSEIIVVLVNKRAW